MILRSSPVIKIVLVILALFSVISWFLIFLKWWQFRRVSKQADRFFAELERTARLEDAYRAVMKLPMSPYRRILKEGVNFFSELRPGALQQTETNEHETLTMTQLEALRMVFAKEVGAERDLMARFCLGWRRSAR